MHVAKSVAVGFFQGVAALFRGIGFICGRPRNWGYASVPAIIAVFLVAALSGLGVFLVEHFLGPYIAAQESAWAVVGVWALRVVLWLVSVLIAALLGSSLAQPLSGFALDELSRRREASLHSHVWPETTGNFARSLRVTFTGLFFGVAFIGGLTLLSLFVPPLAIVTVPLKFYAAALVIAWDLLDYPLAFRGAGVRDRLTFFGKNFLAVSGLGLACGALMLIPGLGLLLLPIGVVAATDLVVRSEGRA